MANDDPKIANTVDATVHESPAVAVPSAAPLHPDDPKRAAPAAPHQRHWGPIIAVIVLIVLLIVGIPWIILALGTVSTDDAYVNGHVTFVAPRVPGQVMKVFVDDNNRVHKGDLLVQLDKEPYEVQVNIAQAAVTAAQADLVTAQATARGVVGQTRSLRFALEHAIEDVDNQAALLKAKVATLASKRATFTKAEADYNRAAPLVKGGAVAQETLDQRREAMQVAQAEVDEALQGVYQVRVSLGLPPQPPEGQDLSSVPPDLDQTFSTVRQAQASLIQSAALLGVSDSFNKSPRQLVADFYKRDPSGDIDVIYAKILKEAPAIKQAEAKLAEAQRNLDQANLNLRYCDVVAEIDGVITRREVNPGNNVVAGQSLMAIRSVTDIWIDANFKETQLAKIRIGQPVDLDVDMYGSKHEFKGRVTGFTAGTGSTLALLPAENATGNFVKVVQRLPVRIDLIDYDPEKQPLFVGLSVTPVVHINEEPSGPSAGQILQPYMAAESGQHRRVNSTGAAGVAPVTVIELNPPLTRRAINPWIIAVAVVIPTFMEVLDTTIANVALRYIAGGLSAAPTDGEWVITSYLAANAIILPISGWIGMRLGRRNYFLLSIAVFTIASALCGAATSLGALIAFRVLQGLAGGGLQPSSQGILLDAFPLEKQGAAQTLFGIAALLAPVVGPTLGGYITDNYGWSWIFYLNLPVGLFALIVCHAVVTDPDYLTEQRKQMRTQHNPFDTLGLFMLSITMVSWEIVLSKGQEWDWFGDPFYRIQTLTFLFVAGLGGLIYRETHIASPLINFKTLKDRNFRACCIIIFCAFGVLYANTTSLPGLLQTLFGYDATTSGLVLSPAGVGAVIILFVVGALLGRGVDARWLMATGLAILAIGNYWMSQLNLSISPWQVVWPRVVVIAGLSMIFAPLNVAAFQYIPKELRGAAVGLLALLRNEGGSVGTSVAQTVLERREQFHTLRLNEHLDSLNPAVQTMLTNGQNFFLGQTGDAPLSRQLTLGVLNQARDQQATSLAYFDVFWVSAVLAAALVFLVFLMRRAAAAKGAHVAAE